jgi:hypothetical protein
MEGITSMMDSVKTAMTHFKMFSSMDEAYYYHNFRRSLYLLPIKECSHINNLAPIRLTANPFPPEHRPRGQADLDSLKYHTEMIRKYGSTTPIWLIKQNNLYTLLDGVHRIAASNLEAKDHVPCYVVDLD